MHNRTLSELQRSARLSELQAIKVDTLVHRAERCQSFGSVLRAWDAAWSGLDKCQRRLKEESPKVRKRKREPEPGPDAEEGVQTDEVRARNIAVEMCRSLQVGQVIMQARAYAQVARGGDCTEIERDR